jgi:aspartyl-tRNA(Asn)/glutamyl-tRNA(Gln) amidotransferase subunit C
MSLEQAEIEKIAELARIRIAPSEMNAVTESISSILAMVDQMQAVDTAAVEPMSNPLDASQRLRADRVSEADHREQFQQIAPKVEEGLYLVPRVID